MATEPSTQQLGNVGESAVGLKFQRTPFSWGIVNNSRDDRGIDFLANVRDPSLGGREFRIGVQVKTGASYFRRPGRGPDGGPPGWWYSEPNKKHFDYWLGCDVPVLLVLHDEDQDASFWVHITKKAVRSSGKGAEIHVPRHQTVSEQCKDQLLGVAIRQSASLALEGTVLSDGLGEIPSRRRLRYALVVPRMASPHPRTALERPIDAYEAVALLAQGNFRELDEIAERHEEVPHPDAVPADADWAWQFTGAIWHWLATDGLDKLEEIHASAPDQYCATASGVLLACALWRQEQRERAIALLNALVERDDLDALDQGWALVQRSRFGADLGEFDRAETDVATAQQLLEAVHDDSTVSAPMVSALVAGAVRTLEVIASTRRFRDDTENAESIDAWVAQRQDAYLELLKASDTTVSWWRSQDVATALGREQDTNFDAWSSDDPPGRIFGGPMPETNLFAAELNADLAGEHGQWKTLSARRGIQSLMRAASFPDTAIELEEGLDALRRCGDSGRLTKAMRHLLKVGPLPPIAASMAKIPTSEWTHTTARTNFEALALAGDLLDEAAADRLLEQCARAACGEPTELGCTQDEGYFNRPSFATEAAAGVLPAASRTSHDGFAGCLARLPEVPPVTFRRGLTNALFFLDYEQIGLENRQALLSLAERGDAVLSATVRGWSASHGDTVAARSLTQAAAQGDIHSLAEIKDASTFSDSERAALIDNLEGHVEQARSDALAGKGNSGSSAFCHALTRLNLRLPGAARWEPIVAFLGEPRTFLEDRSAICEALAADAELIPSDVREQLAAGVDVATSGSASFWPDAEVAGTGLRLQIALGLIDASEIDDSVARLVQGSHQEREDACLILRSSACANRRLLLRFLARDSDFTVRYRAAQTTAYLVALESSDADVDLAWELARDDGRQLPIALLEGFRTFSGVPGLTAQEISGSLDQHPSAAVRHHVARVQRRCGPSTG
ncbi:MAG: DUF4365 domain-containing protein [Acidimicrobiales bacterium]|nr:DUF4365 domain-containing protein [Acidimicrobiales bacterium]MYB80544.1 DUF4365 domain-containing protein [Acidimicrobiales bacterium]MYI12854.1 DUF4365 domain-containing protein [Acidimicrobiales bacterium]